MRDGGGTADEAGGGMASEAGGGASDALVDGGGPDRHDGGTGNPGPADSGTMRCDATRPDIEGPYFTPDSPERGNLRESGMAGTLLVLRGRVVDASCRPVTTAVVDLWQADDAGAYDTLGYRLRGHVRVDGEGRYEFRTIVPGHYLNGDQYRPAHLHAKVYVGQMEALTTQLYFEGDPYNDIDPWFSEATMLRPTESSGEWIADFDFAV